MSVKEIADLLQVCEPTIRNWIHAGELPAVDVGREWRIAPKDLEAFLEARKVRQTTFVSRKSES